MYTYKRSVGRYKNYTPGYHFIDINRVAVSDLEKLFDILYIVVEDSLFNKELCISLEDYKLSFSQHPDQDINAWLNDRPQEVLKQTKVIPGDRYRFVKLERIFTYGYFHYPADLNLANDRQDQLLSNSAPDVRVAHYRYVNVDYNKINDHSLWTVNGVFTLGVARKDGVYLKSAGLDYIQNKNDLRIGALNFQKLGKLKTIPIDQKKLLEIAVGSNIGWEYDLGIDLRSKTVYLVVNGQLLVDEEFVNKVSDTRVRIDLNSFDVAHHYLNYKKYTRVPRLTNLTKFDNYKREALKKDNTFIIVIDNPTLGVDVSPMTTFLYPNALHTEETFQHPVLLDNGMFPVPYIRTYGIRQRLLNHDLRVYNYYPFMSSGTIGNPGVFEPTVNQGNPGKLNKGYLFKIHGIELKVV